MFRQGVGQGRRVWRVRPAWVARALACLALLVGAQGLLHLRSAASEDVPGLGMMAGLILCLRQRSCISSFCFMRSSGYFSRIFWISGWSFCICFIDFWLFLVKGNMPMRRMMVSRMMHAP